MAFLTRHAPYHRVRDVDDDGVAPSGAYGASILVSIVWLAATLIIALLTFRFLFALLGANPDNGIVNFVYDVSNPFVTPFFNMFNYNYIDDGIGRFEVFTLVAIAVYGIIAWFLARLAAMLRW